MGLPLRSVMLLLLLLLVGGSGANAATPVCVQRDQNALLAFKAGLLDYGGQLATWNSSGNCCAFKGVSCDATGQVVNVTFEAVIDDGCDEEPCGSVRSKYGNPNSANLIGTTLNSLLALRVLNLTNFLLHDVTPTGLSAIKTLQVLSLLGADLKGPVSADIGNIVSLQYLSFDGSSYITLPLPQSLCKLGNLQTLDLSGIGFGDGSKASAIPACFAQLTQLQVLDLQFAGFNGRIPAGLKQLKNLRELLLTGPFNIDALTLPNAGLSGALPLINPGDLPLLEKLYLEGNQFTGSIPASFSNLVSLRELRIGGLYDNQGLFLRSPLAGPIPSSLGLLTKLQVLVLRGASFSGSIPTSLVSLPLTDLLLSDNQLTGPIPATLGANGLLVNLALDSNRLSGAIPSSLGGAGKALLTFAAGNNALTGAIPPSLSQLHLALLNLSRNQLSGDIPQNLGFAITEADRYLDLSYNQLTGALNPPSLWGVTHLTLSHNKLTSLGTGSIPDDGTTGQNVQSFDLHSNQFAGPVPAWVFQIYNALFIDISDNHLTQLPAIDGTRVLAAYINASVNALTGTIPTAFTQVSLLYYLDLHQNQLTGAIPVGFGAQPVLHGLNFADNKLSGPIPSDIFGSQSTNFIFLNNNKLTGAIPAITASSNDLNSIDLSNNLLTGTVPASLFTNAPVLQRLNLGNNFLTGVIPDFSATCGGLQALVLENNKLTGSVLPSGVDFTSCTQLVVYDVSGNFLAGQIPAAINSFTGLQVLDLSSNNISGSVPASLSSLSAIKILDLASNALGGNLPLQQLVAGFTGLAVAGSAASYTAGAPLYTLGYYFPESSDFLRSIQYIFSATSGLVLSRNGFTGPIDPSVGNLKGLHILDLSYNKFSGSIPAAIAQITDLQDLNLSYNLLSGPIPSQLSKFPAADFAGNTGLCGAPLPNKCS